MSEIIQEYIIVTSHAIQTFKLSSGVRISLVERGNLIIHLMYSKAMRGSKIFDWYNV